MNATPTPSAPGTPVLLTSLASAALSDGRGDLELTQEMRGTPVDWGGVFGRCIRLTGPWRLALQSGDLDGSLPASLVSTDRIPGAWRSHHRWNGFDIVQTVAAVETSPGVVRTLRCSRPDGTRASLGVTSAFSPFLMPVLVEGIRPHLFHLETSADEIRVRQRGFGLSVRSNLAPSRLFVNRSSWIGGKFRGRVDELGVEYTVPVSRDATDLSISVTGGIERDLDAAAVAAGQVLADPIGSARAIDAATRTWLDSTPTLRFPDAPDLERGYVIARSALRQLYSAPGDGMTGLVAGFPWYSSIWGRDLAWMLWAVLWLGDFDWVARSIDTVLRFQSRSSVPILGGEPGELAMQLSPGPIFFYGTSDTTLYYPILVEGLGRHSGSGRISDEWADAVQRMVSWGERRTDAASGLLRNGGEAEAISTATSSLSRLRYGIDSPDTTIWDSTDRRDHAIDVQVLWWRALGSAAKLAGSRANGSAARWRGLADHLAATIRSRFVWGAEGYLYDSLRQGRPIEQVRPNALRAVSAGLFPPADARRFVERASRSDLTTGWGVRTLSSSDPAYVPIAYHDGQVWTIATAWAADAALAVGATDLGLAYLSTICARYSAEGGFANECYRGDRAEPFDSCFLLGFSVAPFLTVLFERLWGLSMDAEVGRLVVRPAFPRSWHAASIDNLRFGAGTVALDWTPDRLRVRWSGPGELSVDAGAEVVTVAPGSVSEVSTEVPE
ncbi:MAG: amylo-alpha-1,6-glucosidase [Thermoplasmata archaeon]